MAGQAPKQLPLIASLVLSLIVGLALVHRELAKKPQALSEAIIARARLSDGNPARLDRVFARARRGEPITIGVIGGSITHGQQASRPELAYASLVARWWSDAFPQSKVTLVNAGVNGTGSGYGCLRVQQDLLAAHPDFVIVEFGVNDRDDLAHVQTFEGVVRQIMVDPHQPAVLLLFMMHHIGTNAQALQSEVGRQYQLPMISFRDALWPEIEAGRLKWTDLFFDVIHPNDRGHAAIAEFVESYLQEALDQGSASSDEVPALPAPRFTDVFAKIHRTDAADLKPLVCHGWALDASGRSWTSGVPGSVIEFEVDGPLVELLYARVSTNGGTAKVSVDNEAPILCDGWFDGTWEGYVQAELVGKDFSLGPHRLRIELLNTRNSLSGGFEFRVLGLATSSAP